MQQGEEGVWLLVSSATCGARVHIGVVVMCGGGSRARAWRIICVGFDQPLGVEKA